jgi:hypothetical protein
MAKMALSKNGVYSSYPSEVLPVNRSYLHLFRQM